MYYNLFDIPKIFKESFEKYIEQGFNQMLVEYNFKDVTERCQITLKNSIIDRELCFAFEFFLSSIK
ncbi:hypothetical protein FACS189455_4700 [Bacteroidia bacterium]|nr:hypothetical protein FACS189455_4700 [Bacteroidia bacterium]